MKLLMRGAAALVTAAAVQFGAVAIARETSVLTTDTQKASYMVGHDVGRSIQPIAEDLDLQAFQRAVENAFASGDPLVTEADAQPVAQALMLRAASRGGRAPEGAPVPTGIDRTKAGYLVGADVGRSLLPIREQLDLPVLMQAVRTTVAGAALLMDEAELASVREDFSRQVQAAMQARAVAAGQANRAEGEKFLAQNKTTKGVFTTGSGLQYMVLRQGAGPMPKPSDRVRVHYEGKLLDGTVFDSSYKRNQPAEFALNQVIAGWTEGLSMMPVGAKYRFWIPGDLAYGPKGTPDGSIGPDAVLTFDVELQAIL
ncbi:MAG: FKBP-type peptidyl-prolyl cis-trans isomerase [Pseudomonadota bacterium]|nr:FKBP-type peptidyl-prolyl cis-trans isomerase [Pseudomonadota bacterium]